MYMNSTLESVLRNYMIAYWLRPETAIWRTCDWMALKDFSFREPMAELACGDGLNSYIMLGGNLPFEWDDSLQVRNVSPEEYFDGVDIYDYSSEDAVIPVEVPTPPLRYALGVDWKPNLLKKAALMKTHDALHVADLNDKLFMPDESFMTVFSNSLYWVKNIDQLVAEIYRLLKPGGRLITLLVNSNMRKNMVIEKYFETKCRIFKYLDRGRHLHYEQPLEESEWKKIFTKAGFQISSWKGAISTRLVAIQEVGLRPIAPVIINMAQKLSRQDMIEIKHQWISYFEYLSRPLFENWILDPSLESCYYAVELVKE